MEEVSQEAPQEQINTPQEQNLETPKKKTKKWLVPILVTALVLSLSVAGYFTYRYFQPTETPEEQEQETPDSIFPTSDKGSGVNWRSYNSPKLPDYLNTFHMIYPPTWTLEETVTSEEPKSLKVKLTNQNNESIQITQGAGGGVPCIYRGDGNYENYEGAGLFFTSYLQIDNSEAWRISEYRDSNKTSHIVCEGDNTRYINGTKIGWVEIDIKSETTLQEVKSILEQVIILPYGGWEEYRNDYWGFSILYPKDRITPCLDYITEVEGLRFWGADFTCGGNHDIPYIIGITASIDRFEEYKEPISIVDTTVNGVPATRVTYKFTESDGPLFSFKQATDVFIIGHQTNDKSFRFTLMGTDPEYNDVFYKILETFRFTNRPSNDVGTQTESYTSKISDSLSAGLSIEKTDNPQLEFPSDIYQEQIKHYFKLGSIYFALAMENSTNVSLDLGNTNTTFRGILISRDGESQWSVLTEIKDKQENDKNNPYYLWTDSKELFLSVVDQNGAGSGEGMMKVFKFVDEKNWELTGCYYFGSTYNGPSTDGDYFAFTSKLSEQTSQPLSNCNSVSLVQ
ncbi:hypothetical protein ACFLZ4_02430 [Patescibacteria group bacterium]